MNRKGSSRVLRTFDLLDRYRNEYNYKTDALAGMNGKEWYRYTAQEYVDNVEYVALGLLSLGVKPDDKIATVTNNRPEWNFFDMGLAMIGAVHVPIYPTISIEEYEYIIKHSEAKYIVLGDKKLYNKISPLKESA